MDDFNAADSRHLVRPRLRLSWSGLRILLRKSWSNSDVLTAAYGTFRFRRPQGLHRGYKGAPIVVKADGLGLGKCRRCGDSWASSWAVTRCCWTINSWFRCACGHREIPWREELLFAFVIGDKFLHHANGSGPQTCLWYDKGPNTGGWVPMRQFLLATEYGLLSGWHYCRFSVLKEWLKKDVLSWCPLRGLIQTADGMKVIESIARFEILKRKSSCLFGSDFAQNITDILDGKEPVTWRTRVHIGVVVASNGYPLAYEKGAVSSQDRWWHHHYYAGAKLKWTRPLKRRTCLYARHH